MSVDDILGIIDGGLQTSEEHGYGTEVDRDHCARCQRHAPATDGDLCAGCRSFLLEDTDIDPAAPTRTAVVGYTPLRHRGIRGATAHYVVGDEVVRQALTQPPPTGPYIISGEALLRAMRREELACEIAAVTACSVDDAITLLRALDSAGYDTTRMTPQDVTATVAGLAEVVAGFAGRFQEMLEQLADWFTNWMASDVIADLQAKLNDIAVNVDPAAESRRLNEEHLARERRHQRRNNRWQGSRGR